MSTQEKISLLLRTSVHNIINEIISTTGVLTDERKRNLRIQFDAQLSHQCGDINHGQYRGIIKKHMIGG